VGYEKQHHRNSRLERNDHARRRRQRHPCREMAEKSEQEVNQMPALTNQKHENLLPLSKQELEAIVAQHIANAAAKQAVQ
jgi:hypothetical protein